MTRHKEKSLPVRCLAAACAWMVCTALVQTGCQQDAPPPEVVTDVEVETDMPPEETPEETPAPEGGSATDEADGSSMEDVDLEPDNADAGTTGSDQDALVLSGTPSADDLAALSREETKTTEVAIADVDTSTATRDHPITNSSAAANVEDDAEGEKSEVVLLGSPELTMGIPGEGPLTTEEIQAWLDNPRNHEALSVQLPLGLSAAATNIKGLDENPLTRAKIELGRQLYFDTRLSADNTVSCASCHHPDEGWGKRTQFGVGIRQQTGNRNSPVSYNRIVSDLQFWDGRAASLEDQAVGPIENPIEMGNTHDACVRTVANIDGYRMQFERVFPEDGVTIDNIGKAIASFERVIVTGAAPYDYLEIVRGIESQYDEEELADLEEEDPELYEKYQTAKAGMSAMSESAVRGRDLFFTEKSNCTACHAGANFTDEQYHNLGVGMENENPDPGRAKISGNQKDFGAFKTPTLRNVAVSAPYMHDGSQATLEEVVEWYVKGGHPNDYLSEKVKKLDLTDQDKSDLVAFMVEGLTGSFPPVETDRLPE